MILNSSSKFSAPRLPDALAPVFGFKRTALYIRRLREAKLLPNPGPGQPGRQGTLSPREVFLVILSLIASPTASAAPGAAQTISLLKFNGNPTTHQLSGDLPADLSTLLTRDPLSPLLITFTRSDHGAEAILKTSELSYCYSLGNAHVGQSSITALNPDALASILQNLPTARIPA